MSAVRRGAPFAALVLLGCGYTFGSGLDRIGVRTIALRVVGNETFRQRLEVDLTRALIGEDLSSARAELVDDLARKIALSLESDF